MTTETDGGVPFGTRYRIRNDATHIVAAGDTLFRLALRYGVSLNSIAAENNLPSTGIIFVGQELVIPGRGEEVRRNQGGTEASNESEIQTAYRQEALEYLFDESWGDHDIKFGAELPDADKEKLVQQTLDNALHLFSNADCSTTNSCGTDVFTPSPVTFGDCGVGGCATTVPIEFLSGCDEGSCQVAVPGFEETTDGGVVAVPSAPRVTGEAVATKQLLVKGKAYDTVIIKTKDGTHYATRPSDGHVFGQVKESKSRPGFWNPKGGEFKSPPPLQHVTAEVFAFLHAGDPGTHKYYQFRPSEVGGCDVSNSCSADSAILETDIESVLPFLDGFESGDTTAWSSTVP
jgi:LysM repeat protein